MGVAYAPVSLLLKRPLQIPIIAITAGIIVLLKFRKYQTKCTYEPSLAEFLLAGISATSMPAFVGLLWMLLYGILYGGTWVISQLITLIGLQASWNLDAIAYYPSMVMILLFGLTILFSDSEQNILKLYPGTAGLRSVYYQFFTSKRSSLVNTTIIATLVFAGVSLLFLFTSWNLNLYFIFIQFFLFYGAIPMSINAELEQSSADAINLVGDMYREAGFDIEWEPRTEDASIDPLLVNLDLLATKGGQHVFVTVKEPSKGSAPTDYKTASALEQAAWVLSDARGLPMDQVETRVVMFGTTLEENKRKGFYQTQVGLTELSGEDIARIKALKKSGQNMKDLAVRYLEISDE